jgi:hypothetical protein
MRQARGGRPRGTGPSRPRQRGFVSSRQALVLLALLFLMPVLVAWLLNIGAEHGWRPAGTTNKGTLIQPPRPLELPADLLSATGEPLNKDFLGGKWTLIYVGNTACEKTCRQRLYQMRQVRLAQGENMRRVQRLFLATGRPAAPGFQQVIADYPKMAVALLSPQQAAAIAPVFRVDGLSMQGADNLYLVDPLGFLMMYYGPDADPRGTIQDLQRLLKYSHTG